MPRTVARQAPLAMGFSRQEQWYSRSVMCDPATPRTVARQAPLAMGFPRQEYYSGLPRPPPGDLPNPGTEPGSPALQVDSLPSEPPGKPYFLPNLILLR